MPSVGPSLPPHLAKRARDELNAMVARDLKNIDNETDQGWD